MRLLGGARQGVRPVLRWAAHRLPARRFMDNLVTELTLALDETSPEGLYDAFYYGEGRDPLDRAGISGYSSYDRRSSLANVAAYCVWSVFEETRSLDIGCALGYTVEALREVGFDSYGIDHSEWAVRHCARGARGRVRQADLLRPLPFPDGHFGLVTAFETLEHLPPEEVPGVLRELRRVSSGFLLATIPSFGPNRFGPDGWFEGKVADERVEHYRSLGPDYPGPIPLEDLKRDANDEPIEGHLCIASFGWWEERFREAGFERRGEVEGRILGYFDEFGRTGWWCPYVMAVPGRPAPPWPLRAGEAAARAARRLRVPTPA